MDDDQRGHDAELWSAHDQTSLERVLEAAARGDLFGALSGVERASDDVREASREQIRVWSDAVSSRSRPDRLNSLRNVLVGEAGLRGDRDSYYDVDNSKLSKVLARRRGMPIMVSALWVLVARGAGMLAEGIGLPAHFIARVDGRIVDPFSGGRVLTVEDCQAMLKPLAPQLAWDARFLAPVSAAGVAERTLRNLGASASQSPHWADRATHYRAARMLAALRPDSGRDALAYAQLSESVGTPAMARDVYADIALRFAGQPPGQLANVKLRTLVSEPSILN